MRGGVPERGGEDMSTEGELVYCIRNNVGGLMDCLKQIRRERLEQEGMGGE